MDIYVKGFVIACKGIPTTVGVTLIALLFGGVLGLIIALIRNGNGNKFIKGICTVYVEVVRGTPMVVQALIMAYGIPKLLQGYGIGFKWPILVIPAILVCGLNSAAYMAEVIRSGLQAVDKGQMEAARSLGMTN